MAECSNGPGKGLRCWNPNSRSRMRTPSGSNIISRIKERMELAKSERESKKEAMKGEIEDSFERDFPGDVANEMGIKKKQEKASKWMTRAGGGYKFIKGGIKKK